MTSTAIRPISSSCAVCALCVALVACGSSVPKSGTPATSSGYTQKPSSSWTVCAPTRCRTCPIQARTPRAAPTARSGGSSCRRASTCNLPRSNPPSRRARSCCPGGAPSGSAGSESEKVQLLALAKCMRGHGVPELPRPDKLAAIRPRQHDGRRRYISRDPSSQPAIARVQTRGSRLRNVRNHDDDPAHRHSERGHRRVDDLTGVATSRNHAPHTRGLIG